MMSQQCTVTQEQAAAIVGHGVAGNLIKHGERLQFNNGICYQTILLGFQRNHHLLRLLPGLLSHVCRSRKELPIAYLKSHNISVRSRLTTAAAIPLNLSVAFTDPSLDWDVSKYIEREGVLEIGISQVSYALLAEKCKAGGSGGLVVDVGANFGWYTLLAAKLGCRWAGVYAEYSVHWTFSSYSVSRARLGGQQTHRLRRGAQN